MAVTKDMKVLIVGAGPSGLLLAILLARKGIEATILEKTHNIDLRPRASFYTRGARETLRRAGLMDDIMKQAFTPTDIAWRDVENTEICRILQGGVDGTGEPPLVSLPLDLMLPIMLDHVGRLEKAKLLLNHEVLSVNQDGLKAFAKVKAADGEKTFEADYLVGCDGATSQVRRDLFGEFPGFMWEKQLVATDTYYPNMAKFNWASLNFVVHPDHCAILAQMTQDGKLRITYGEDEHLTVEQIQERQAWKFKQILPGAPDPDEYEIKRMRPYKMHHRCAEKFRVGRILLAADAAHVCNPFGAMGLPGGINDIAGLFDCFYGIWTGQADDSILDKYSEIRLKIYKDVIAPESANDFKRLWNPSQDAINADPFFQIMRSPAEHPEKIAAVNKILGADTMSHDFTQYYKYSGH